MAKRAQEQAEQRYRALVQSSHCLVCELDGDLQIVYASTYHKEILEYDPAVLMGQSWLNFVHPDDRKQSEYAPRRMLADGITDRKVIRFRSRLNRWRWLEEMSRCLKELGVDYGQGYYFGAPVPIDQAN